MPAKSILNVSIALELAAKAKTGYHSASEVVQAALRLLDERDQREVGRLDTTVQIDGRGDAQ